jgi:LysR family transcriptional regulator, hypochlorite-specific transcription factor HypT
MRLEWLEDIVAVAETGSFSEAAERRRLTQSAFSRRIAGIEAYLGVELFDRTRKPVQLRPTTEAQRERIVELVSGLRQLADDLRRGDRRSSNRIVIASQHALTTSLTPSILKGIQTRGENTYVRLRSANLDECFALLLSRQADIALVYRVPGEDQPVSAAYIETLKISADRLIPVYSRAALPDLNDRFTGGEIPYIAYPREVFLGQTMERFILPRFRSLTRPVAAAETALTLAALEMAAVGVAVAWIPASLAQARLRSGELVDLTETLPDCALEVTAARLLGTSGDAEDRVWEQLSRPLENRFVAS